MTQIPSWLGAIGALCVIAAALGAAVAVYRTNLQSTSLRETERSNERLRADLSDADRRALEQAGEISVLTAEKNACNRRVQVLEDLVSRRKDDDVIKGQLEAILTAIADLRKKP